MKRKALRQSKSVRAKKPVAPKAKAARTKPTEDIGVLVEANAQALGLPLDPAWRDVVAFNLRLIFRMASLVDEFPLPDDTEPAPVFHA